MAQPPHPQKQCRTLSDFASLLGAESPTNGAGGGSVLDILALYKGDVYYPADWKYLWRSDLYFEREYMYLTLNSTILR
jgi:hypothetical protein